MKKVITFFLLLITLSFYGQSDTISVVKHSDNDLIIPKNLKVVYRGLPNQLIIEVPNCKSFSASGNGLTLVSKNLYSLNPGAGLEVIVSIDIVFKNNKKITEKHSFKIKNVITPDYYLNFNKCDTIVRLRKKQLENAEVKVVLSDKNLNIKFQVTKFQLKIPGRETIQVYGNKIDIKTFNEINKYASKGDLILIYDVSSKREPPISGCILMSPMAIQIY